MAMSKAVEILLKDSRLLRLTYRATSRRSRQKPKLELEERRRELDNVPQTAGRYVIGPAACTVIAPRNIEHTLCQNKADLNHEPRRRQKAG